MKIAVTNQDRKTITGNASKCRTFWIYEIDGKTIVKKTLLESPLEQSFHESHGSLVFRTAVEMPGLVI